VPDSIVCKVKEPLDLVASKPLAKLTAPPIDDAEPPAEMTTRPPFDPADVAEPTDTVTLPDGPLLEDEDITCSEPLLPLEAEPDESVRLPLTPEALDVPVSTVNDPLDESDPKPDVTETEPPSRPVDDPAEITTRPLSPLFPLPTVTLMLPAVPSVAFEDLSMIKLLLPEFEEPLLICSNPLVP